MYFKTSDPRGSGQAESHCSIGFYNKREDSGCSSAQSQEKQPEHLTINHNTQASQDSLDQQDGQVSSKREIVLSVTSKQSQRGPRKQPQQWIVHR